MNVLLNSHRVYQKEITDKGKNRNDHFITYSLLKDLHNN